MDTISQIILQLALITVPAGAVLMTAIYFMRRMTEQETRNTRLELKKERQTFFLPNRLDAYQRAILLMERIHPNSLIMRHNNTTLPATALQLNLLESIREEYEHNLAQQMFISDETWDLVKRSKDETMKIINLAGQKLAPNASGMDLMNTIFTLVGEIGTLPSEIAVRALKKEVQQLF